MKTKDLIARLQREDPSGELECCVGNEDIYLVERLPSYYDGDLEVLVRDPANKFYNVVGAKIMRGGFKVNLRPLSLDEALQNDPDLPVECDMEKYGNWLESRRKAYREEE